MPDETTIVGASASFAPSSFARLRLLRQLHACGLLSTRDHASEPDAEPAVERAVERVGELTVTARRR